MVIPFVVRQKDVDLFDSLDDLVVTTASPAAATETSSASSSQRRKKFQSANNGDADLKASSTLPEESVEVEGLERLNLAASSSFLSPSRNNDRSYSGRNSRRSSISSAGSCSRCSKSIGMACELMDWDYSFRSSTPSVSRRRRSFDGDLDYSFRTTPACVSRRRRSLDGNESLVSTTASTASEDFEENDGNLAPTPMLPKKTGRRYSLSLVPSLPPLETNRRVTFSKNVTVRLVVDDFNKLSNEEKAGVWYTPEELQQVKREGQQLIRDAKAKKISTKNCGGELRGLHMTKKKQRKAHASMVKKCLLDEQFHMDAKHLAKLYSSLSYAPAQIAIKVAAQDAQAAQAALFS